MSARWARRANRRLPSFLIMGAQKCGTTSLYHYLRGHRDVQMSRRKETDFFLGGRRFQKGLAWYVSQFERSALAVGEASPNYSRRHLFPGVPERIRETLPEVKLVYIVRDPVPRVVSHYVHDYSAGRERRTLSGALARLEDNDYVLTGCYDYQLEPFLRAFPRDRILILVLEELRRDAPAVMTRLLDFLGVDAAAEPAGLGVAHHESRSKRASIFDAALPSWRLRVVAQRVLPAPLSWSINATLEASDRSRLERHFRPGVERLRAMTGLPLADWSV